MARRFTEPRLVLASHNPGKLAELKELLAPHGASITTSRELGLPEPAETGRTFADNARLKAHAAAQASGLPALADNSGLEAHGLGGAPGVHSARWAGPGARLRAGRWRGCATSSSLRFGAFARADRGAAFVAVLCLAWPDGHEELAEGRVEGELVDPPRGAGGFGYDPMFVPAGERRTFAEMDQADKQKLSHRARALRRLIAMCFEQP